MNIFIVTSTINSHIGVFSPEERYDQTKSTISSIREKVPDSIILFVDNSEKYFDKELDFDYRIPFNHNLFTKFVNKAESKGLGESYMLNETFNFIKQNNIIGERIFKISGRYNLAKGFDISEYQNPKYKDMYAFRVNDWDVTASSGEWYGSQTVRYYETRLYSLSYSLLEEYQETVKNMFEIMITSWGKLMNNWEMCHCYKLPEEKIIKMDPIHLEGLNAVNGVYRFE